MNKKIITFVSFTALFIGLSGSIYAALDKTVIPLGDGKVSSSPKGGYVYSCQQNFSNNAGGAGTNGSWIHGSTWSLPEKLSVQGKVIWPTATYSTSMSGSIRTITTNSLPVDSYTGTFPISTSDPAYQVDRNPSTISAQSVSLSLPALPSSAQNASCVGMGMIGVASNGVAIFNALDAGGRDAVAHEVQDICGGHPQQEGEYHYHGPSSCLPNQDKPDTLLGYALDGYGIYSNTDANGRSLDNSDLDECHGTSTPIMWNGTRMIMYHYVLTYEYPYTIGCYRGTTSSKSKPTPGTISMMPISGTIETSPRAITTSLSVGSHGTDVETLQKFLENKGYLTIPEGQSRGYFGAITKKALMKYQKANGITQTGTFGPRTRQAYSRERQSGGILINEQGELQSNTSASGRPTGGPNRGTMLRTPPKEASDACSSKRQEDTCSFSGMNGETVSGVCFTPGAMNETSVSTLVCGPKNMGAR